MTSPSDPAPAVAVDPIAVSLAPEPTEKTLRRRTFLPYQAMRFGAVSLRMLAMVRRSHH